MKRATDKEIIENYKKFCQFCSKQKKCKDFKFIKQDKIHRTDHWYSNNGCVFCYEFTKKKISQAEEKILFDIIKEENK